MWCGVADEEIPTLSYRPVKRDGTEHVAGGKYRYANPGPVVRYPDNKLDYEAAKKLAREILENMKADSPMSLSSGFQIEYIGPDESDEPTIVPAPKD